MESRQYFVKQVAQTIKDNHAQHGESFIFGISGKWGEGKTRFLGDLEVELKNIDSTFEIYKINPWKFSTDKTAFLRNFLKILYQKKAHWVKRVRDFFNYRNDLRLFYTDTSENNIHPGWLLIFVVYLALIIGLYIIVRDGLIGFIPDSVRDFVITWKWLGSIILLPIFISLIGKMITVQKSNHAISTVDQFDSLFGEILEELDGENKKVIVFVDDLDRVTPEIARDVLDNLRTFFDKKQVTFIVTGDHTVLERYLGKDLMPNSDMPDQLEEGRRFMKKIFNVYWRLPLPIEQEINKFLDGEFTKKSTALAAIFIKEAEQRNFKNYLKKYFDKNFRQIIRFLDTVIFTFQIVKQKSETGTEKEKPYFNELLEKPLLVIRILMIQELCAPLFDKILENYQLLADLEYAVEKKNTDKINALLEQYREELSSFQQNFIKKFIYEEPRFFKESSLTVSDIRPFLFLAADASFGDSRGPSTEDFIGIIGTGDPAQVKNALLSMGDQKAEEGIKALIAQLHTLPESTKVGNMKTLLSALMDLPADYSIHKIFSKELAGTDINFLNAQPNPQRTEIFQIFWGWLDHLDASLSDAYLDKFPLQSDVDFGPIIFEQAGYFTSRMASRWLKEYHAQNTMEAVKKMNDIFPKIRKEYHGAIEKELAGLETSFADNIEQDTNIENREKRLTLMKGFMPAGRDILRTKTFNGVGSLNAEIFQWSISKADGSYWSKDELEENVLAKIQPAADLENLTKVFNFIVEHKIADPNKVWSSVSDSHLDIMVENLPTIINNAYDFISPPEEMANKLMEKTIVKIRSLDEAGQLQWFDYIRKEKWPWKNLTKRLNKKVFATISKSENEALKNLLDEIVSTWKTV